jgi:hypothetical protein
VILHLRKAPPVVVAALAVACYVSIIVLHRAAGGDLRDYIQLGTRFIKQTSASPDIRIDPHYHYLKNRHGYDGQFYYYIAVDPLRARYYMDRNSFGRQAVAYRYGRILYPMAARLLALGRPAWVPGALLLVNLFGLGLGTIAIAAWLVRFGLVPWLALVYAFYPGVALGVLMDLSDPLAFSLVAAGVYIVHFGKQHRLLWSGCVFALAGLTRDATLLVPVMYALWLLSQRQTRSALALALLSVVPLLLWKLFLLAWLGSLGLPAGLAPSMPLTGIFYRWTPTHPIELLGVMIPSLLMSVLAVAAWLRGVRSIQVPVLLANVLLFVLLLNPTSYVDIYGSARMAIGVPLFALFSLPRFLPVLRVPTWLVLSACIPLWALALALTYGNLPVA